MKKTVVVFGATGKVGCYSALHLRKVGFDVIAVGHRPSDNGFFADHDLGNKNLLQPTLTA